MATINNSYNSSNILAKETIGGGIAGYNGASISNSYNIGELKTDKKTSKIGGICGQNASESYIYTSYNIGKINNAEYIGGVVGTNFGKIDKCFYLDSSIYGNATDAEYSKNETELKTTVISELGEAFSEDSNNRNSGYPIFIWQNLENVENN